MPAAMNEQHEQARMVYIAMAALAGAVTSLSGMPWRTMSWPEIFMTLFVGTAFAVLLVPWLAADWLHVDISNLRAICAVTYLGATGANVFIPVIIRKVKRLLEVESKA
jgi:hypothetical protein